MQSSDPISAVLGQLYVVCAKRERKYTLLCWNAGRNTSLLSPSIVLAIYDVCFHATGHEGWGTTITCMNSSTVQIRPTQMILQDCRLHGAQLDTYDLDVYQFIFLLSQSTCPTADLCIHMLDSHLAYSLHWCLVAATVSTRSMLAYSSGKDSPSGARNGHE